MISILYREMERSQKSIDATAIVRNSANKKTSFRNAPGFERKNNCVEQFVRHSEQKKKNKSSRGRSRGRSKGRSRSKSKKHRKNDPIVPIRAVAIVVAVLIALPVVVRVPVTAARAVVVCTTRGRNDLKREERT